MRRLPLRYLAAMAFRNLWRHKRRTFLTFIALSIGLMGLIQVDSLVSGLDEDAIQNLINLETGDVRMHGPGYFEKREEFPIDKTVDAKRMTAVALRAEGVLAATPRLVFPAAINTGWEELPVAAVAIDPATDPKVYRLDRYVEGAWPAPRTPEAIVGSKLAELLELEIGDFFTLVTRTEAGAFQAIDLTLVGIAETSHPEINSGHVYLPIGTAALALGLDGRATEIAVRIKETASPTGVRDRIAALLGEEADGAAEVFTWRQAAADFLEISRTERMVDGIFLMMIVLIGTVGIVNTILLSALERRREIGIMKALGMREREILGQFMLEAAGIGLLGSITGCLLGILINVYMVNVGIDITFYGDIDIGYPVTGTMRGSWNWPVIAGAFVFGILVSLIASYFPARAAAAQDPVATLRR